jgi:CRP-like cAMP-binding protein
MATRIHSCLEALMLSEERPRRLAAGELLFQAGETGREMFIVRTGTVELRLGRRLLEAVGPGGVVGEMALIDPAPRSASAVAGEGCSVVAIDEQLFGQLVRTVPSLALEMMRILARRLRRGNESRAARTRLARKPVPQRPARQRAAKRASR